MIQSRSWIDTHIKTDDQIEIEDRLSNQAGDLRSNQDRGLMIKSRQKTDDQIKTEDK